MKAAPGHKYRNKVLRSLPATELRALEPHLTRMKFPREFKFQEAGRPMANGYFLETGLASVVVLLKNGTSVEVGVVGPEGIVGLPILLETEAMPNDTFMQIPGEGYRVKASVLREILPQHPQLHQMAQRYLHLHFVQAAQTAACNRLHGLEERLARWLLICFDRVNSEEVKLTHEFLAHMLGTRRSSVSLAAERLQRAGLIHYSRSQVAIRDVEGLKEATCECYRAIHDEQVRLGLL
jgi:CRP-like cAMP-binding protein